MRAAASASPGQRFDEASLNREKLGERNGSVRVTARQVARFLCSREGEAAFLKEVGELRVRFEPLEKLLHETVL